MPRNYSPVRIPKGQERTTPKARLDASKQGKDLPVTLGDMFDQQVGSVPGPEVRAVHDLARAIHYSESTECSVSWEAQERAREFFNLHGFVKTLDEMFRLKALQLPDARP